MSEPRSLQDRLLATGLRLLFPGFLLPDCPSAADVDELRRRRTILTFVLALSACVPVFCLVYLLLLPRPSGGMAAAAICAAFGLGAPATIWFLRRGRIEAGLHVGMFALYLALVAVSWFSGGLRAPALYWLALLPTLAITLIGPRSAAICSGMCAVAFAGYALEGPLGLPIPDVMTPGGEAVLRVVCMAGLAALILLLVIVYEYSNSERLKQLSRARADAERASAAKSAFLANMSHEIRTPITAVLGYADLLLDGRSELESTSSSGLDAEAVSAIRRNAQSLLALLNDVLDLSKIEAEQLDVEQLVFSPQELVHEVRSSLALSAEAKGLTLDYEIASPIPERIRSDPTRLRQVLVNLVGNAIKFSDHGRVRIGVRCVADPQPRMYFCVTDSGIGMTEEQQARLFQPFTQADSSMSRRYGGTGLGLTISKRLAELLGGTLDVVSEYGLGSEFRLTLPAEIPPESRWIEPRASVPDTPRELGPRRVPGRSGGGLEIRILLAEDGVDNQRLLDRILRGAGAEVTLADDGARARDLALAAREAGSPFDVIVMDMQMPVMDGYEATRRLREASYEGPILALTAHALVSERERCLAAGCDDFDTKPIDRARLFAKLHALTEKAR